MLVRVMRVLALVGVVGMLGCKDAAPNSIEGCRAATPIERRVGCELRFLDTPEAVEHYVAGLERDARRQGSVTAYHMIAGTTALESTNEFPHQVEAFLQIWRFEERMGSLATELRSDGRKSLLELYAVTEQAAYPAGPARELSAAIARAHAEGDREVLELTAYRASSNEAPLRRSVEDVKTMYVAAQKADERAFYRRKLEAAAKLAWAPTEGRAIEAWLERQPR